MSTFISYTIGLVVTGSAVRKPTLAKVEYNTHKDGVKLNLVSGSNLGKIHKAGTVVVSQEEFDDRPRDPYNDTVEAQWAFNKLGVSA